MAKPKESVIALETEKYEDKIKEFQSYLEQNSVVTKIAKNGNISEAEDAQEKRHKEILIQIKMMDALPNWLTALKKLREEAEEEKMQLRGGGEMSTAARLMMDRDKQ